MVKQLCGWLEDVRTSEVPTLLYLMLEGVLIGVKAPLKMNWSLSLQSLLEKQQHPGLYEKSF